MTQGLSGVRKRYQGVAEQPWGLGDPMVVQARTPNKFRKAPSRHAKAALRFYAVLSL
jgi:hypothetical protein